MSSRNSASNPKTNVWFYKAKMWGGLIFPKNVDLASCLFRAWGWYEIIGQVKEKDSIFFPSNTGQLEEHRVHQNSLWVQLSPWEVISFQSSTNTRSIFINSFASYLPGAGANVQPWRRAARISLEWRTDGLCSWESCHQLLSAFIPF